MLAADLPTVLVGLDVTNQVRVTPGFAERFAASVATDSAAFWHRVLETNDWFIESGEYYFWDVLAAMTAMAPGLCKGEAHRLGVAHETTDSPWLQTTDTAMPDRRWDGKPRSHLEAASAGTLVADPDAPPVTVCLETDPGRVFRDFRRVLNDVPLD